MKKIILILSVFLLMGASCDISKNISTKGDNKAIVKGSYIGSYYEGNYIWGAAMNLAWNEMKDNIIKEDIKLDTKDNIILAMLDSFNMGVFDKSDMNENSYYIKSGFGQNTVDTINKESRKKFPSKSFDDLEIYLGSLEFISYAYFLKEVEYLTEFKKDKVDFNDQSVKGFYAGSDAQRDNIQVVKYWSDNKFIVALKLKQENDIIFLAKGFDMDNPENIVAEINKYNSFGKLASIDSFKMPELHLDYHRDYEEFIGKNFINDAWKKYSITKMFENIKFDMDNKGARVENEGVIAVEIGAMPPEENKIRNFILDEPFWVLMKQKDSDNPYFILGVNNVGIMEL